MIRKFICVGVFTALAVAAYAGVFGTVRAIVHDPHHRPVANAEAVLESRTSAFSVKAVTDSSGVVQFLSVPIGEYRLRISAPGFAISETTLTAISDRVQELHIPLDLPKVQESVSVSAEPAMVDPSVSASQTNISRANIERLPGADRSNSLSFITSTVPGATIVHDQLHIRGGHQVTWAIDG